MIECGSLASINLQVLFVTLGTYSTVLTGTFAVYKSIDILCFNVHGFVLDFMRWL